MDDPLDVEECYLQRSYDQSASSLKDFFVRPIRMFLLNLGSDDVVITEKDDTDS